MGLTRSKNYKTALKTADTWFSRYIRVRDADKNGFCRCITCNTIKHYKEIDAGHFLSRQYMPTRFDERNVHAQCPKCNQYGSGEQYLHSLAINRKYPEGTLDELLLKSRGLAKFNKVTLMELARLYNKKYKHECNTKGLPIDFK